MKIALFSINAASVEPLAQATAGTVVAAGHRCVRICYWLSDHLPIEALSSQDVPLLTLVDGGFPGAPRLTAEQYTSAGGAISNFHDLALHDHAVHGWPLSAERLGSESIYYQRLRGIALKVRNLLKGLAPDATIVTHGAEPISRAIAIESAALGIPVLPLESSFFPGHITLDVGGQHFFPQTSRLARILPARMATPLSPAETAEISRFVDAWLRDRTSKYAQASPPAELARVDAYVGGASGRVAFLPAQLSWDANVIPHLREYPTLWDLYADAIAALNGWRVIVKVHPMDTTDAMARLAGCENAIVVHDVSIHDLVPRSDVVVALSSNVGLEAMIIGKPVVLLGRPFYGDLGLTSDVERIGALAHAAETARAPDRERLGRLLHSLVFQHLLPIGDAGRMNARLEEAKASGSDVWRTLEQLSGNYGGRARTYLRLADRYNDLARQNLCDADIRAAIDDLQAPQAGPQDAIDGAEADPLPMDYSEVDKSALAFHAFAASAVRPGLRVLHLDCGAGYGSMLLADHAASVDAVDATSRTIAFAQQAWAHERIRYHRASVGPWLAASRRPYDVIVAHHTLERIYDPRSLLKTAWAVLAPGGVMLVSTANGDDKPLSLETRCVRRFTADDLGSLMLALPNLADCLVAQQHETVIATRRPNATALVTVASKSGSPTAANEPIETMLPFVMAHVPQRKRWHIGANQFSTGLGKGQGLELIYVPGESKGHIVFGPYRKLPAGSYQVTFDVVAADGAYPSNGALIFEVVDTDDLILGQIAFTGQQIVARAPVKIAFSHAKTDVPLEFRIHSDGAAISGTIVFKGVTLECGD